MGISFRDVAIKRDRTLLDKLKEIKIGNTTYVFGNVRPPFDIRHFNLEVPEGEILALVDSWQPWYPSAVLRAAAGLEEVTQGNISMSNGPSSLAYIENEQNKTVKQAWGYYISSWAGLRDATQFMASRVRKEDSQESVKKYSEVVGLRVSRQSMKDLTYTERMIMELVCAAAKKPQLILVDRLTENAEKPQMLKALQQLQKEIGGTWLYATGCMGETIDLANKVAYMNNGTIEWILPSNELFSNPPNAHAARELGYTLLKGTIYKNHYPGGGGSEFLWNDCTFMSVEQGSMRLPYLKERPDQLRELNDRKVIVAIHPEAVSWGRYFHRHIDNWDHFFVPSFRANLSWDPYDIPMGDYLFPDPSKLRFYDAKDCLPIDIGYIGPKLDTQKVRTIKVPA